MGLEREIIQPRSLTKRSLVNAARDLAARDKDLAAILTAYGTPPLWAREPGFPTLIRIILEQQVSLASASATFERLAAHVAPFTPERFQELGESYLRALGLTRQKASYLWQVSEAVSKRKVNLPSLSRMSDEDAKAQLTQLKGIGSWTADIYLLMALGRADVWPSGDLALATAVRRLKRLRARPDPEKLAKIAAAWRPFRSVAARMLWQYYLAYRARRDVRAIQAG